MTGHLLVIGAQRCGTTALHSLLDAHPEITMARPARPEPKVFLDEDRSALGVDWYRAQYFAHARDELLLGDKSTSYLEHPEAAHRAAEVLGRADIVVQLRDPVERAVSNWRFSSRHGLETRPLEDALQESLEGREPAWDRARTSVSPFAYLARGRYADQLPAWERAFPGAVHVVFLAELVADHAAVERLWRSLGVSVEAGGRLLERENESDGDAPALSAALRGRLEAYFADSDAALRAWLGRDLPW